MLRAPDGERVVHLDLALENAREPRVKGSARGQALGSSTNWKSPAFATSPTSVIRLTIVLSLKVMCR